MPLYPIGYAHATGYCDVTSPYVFDIACWYSAGRRRFRRCVSSSVVSRVVFRRSNIARRSAARRHVCHHPGRFLFTGLPRISLYTGHCFLPYLFSPLSFVLAYLPFLLTLPISIQPGGMYKLFQCIGPDRARPKNPIPVHF